MKRILGLDLGTTSIGWALVQEAETKEEKSSIVRIGVRVNPLTTDEQTNFEKGKPVTTNSERRLKRSARRNLQRYKLRREHLLSTLKSEGWIHEDTILSENGPRTTFETLHLRAKAATESITLEEFSRVLLMINKKRGYKSSRKVQNDDEGQIIDGMAVAKILHERHLTPGQYAYELLSANIDADIPDFYRSDLYAELERIWETQRQFYPDILTDELKEALKDKNEKQTWAICEKPFAIEGIKRQTKGKELQKENYGWRAKAVSEKMDPEELVVVLQKINSQSKNSSGYLGNISDRSKELYFNSQTIGQYLWEQVCKDSHFSLKNKVFFRQDYMDEFDRIWETQAKYHPELTLELKKTLRDETIFFQRRLKSQKNLISICELEGKEVEIEVDGRKKKKLIGPKVCPKSSPLFQEFKIRQIINNLTIDGESLTEDEKQRLFDRAKTCDKLGKADILKCLGCGKDARLNYKEIEGDRTSAALLRACAKILEISGHGEWDFSKMDYSNAEKVVGEVFTVLGADSGFLHFDSEAEGKDFENQPSFRLWHLLYSYEGDNSSSGIEKLIDKIQELTGLDKEYAKILSNVSFLPDYGNLSVRAMKKILPYLKGGNDYGTACAYAGYRHSKESLTKEERDAKTLKDRLERLPKNRLRNPVVEKILNQMVNVVNAVIDEYGKPDEIRIELARELKKSAKERAEMTDAIGKADREHQEIRRTLQEKFGISHPGRNDIIRYKLYKELEMNGYKTLYSNTYIPEEKLFSKEFDIEHIIPQARLFDDSFSNKTLEVREVNIRKSNATAYDFVKDRYGEDGLEAYVSRVERLYKEGRISKAKRNKLTMSLKDIPDGFIERDLRQTQYIAKKAKQMLEEIVRQVVPTTGTVTDRLREDWRLVDLMKELNWDKYKKLGLTEIYEDKDGRRIGRINGWTKRNDHRHHAMDALTIAFTKRSFIQYLNFLNARIPKDTEEEIVYLSEYDTFDIDKKDRSQVVRYIESTQLYRDSKGKLRFRPPIPLEEFRAEARHHLENTLISIKAKNKVVTRNVNRSKARGKTNSKVQLTPRGPLHKETVYGRRHLLVAKEEKIGSGFDEAKIAKVAKPLYRRLLMKRLEEFGGDPKKAFSGKNSLAKVPIFLDETRSATVPERVLTLEREQDFTIRKEINPDLKIEKVIDDGIRRILQRRLEEFGGDPKRAFVNLEDNPIWLNREKGIQIKRVKISGVNNAVALHDKRDKNGAIVLDSAGRPVPTDYVSTGSNHHVAIFRDEAGNLQEHIVSFYEAVVSAGIGDPVVNKHYNEEKGWSFLFTMKQNEYFVFPNPGTGFDPRECDLMDPDNCALISPNLYRVQKLATKNYVFRHHLETNVEESKELRDTAWKRIQTISLLEGIVKVRIDHLGKIVQIGEY